MRRIILACLILTFVNSCSRDNTISRLQGEPEISFDIDGKHFEYKGEPTVTNGGVGAWATKATGVPGWVKTLYSFSGTLNNQNIIGLTVYITPPDTLKTMTYPTILIMKADDITYGLIGSDVVNATIRKPLRLFCGLQISFPLT